MRSNLNKFEHIRGGGAGARGQGAETKGRVAGPGVEGDGPCTVRSHMSGGGGLGLGSPDMGNDHMGLPLPP